MFTITDTIEAARHPNDFLRSINEPKPVGNFDEGEVRIRTQLRANVRDELKYTTKDKRGAGKTYEAILIRNARRDHSASIRRQPSGTRRCEAPLGPPKEPRPPAPKPPARSPDREIKRVVRQVGQLIGTRRGRGRWHFNPSSNSQKRFFFQSSSTYA
jgi:hypothetical protein